MPTTKRFRKRDTWLEARRKIIGASETPAILGYGYAGQSAFAIWKDKVHGTVASETPQKLRIGQVVEESIRQLYEEETGDTVHRPKSGTWEIHYHDELPFVGATLDGLNADNCPVEIKNVGQWQADEWVDGAPLRYRIQLAHQQAILDAPYGVLVALLGGQELLVRRFDRNYRFEQQMLASLKNFWQSVERQEPPQPDGSPGTSAAIAEMFGESMACAIEVANLRYDVETLSELKSQIKQLEHDKSLIENRIKLQLGEREYGIQDDVAVSWRPQQRTVYDIPEEVKNQYARTTTYRVFRVLKSFPRNVEIINVDDSAATTGNEDRTDAAG